MPTYNPKAYCSSYEPLETKPMIQGNSEASDPILYKIFLPQYENLVTELTTILAPNEVETAQRYYKTSDQQRYIISRSLLKLALAYHSQSKLQDIIIEGLPNKKPYLPKQPHLHFNVSHSKDYALFAISTVPVGIDVEFIDNHFTFEDVLPHVFNDLEIDYIHHSSPKAKAFYSLWTRKEALVKALGQGLHEDLIKTPSLNGEHHLNPSFSQLAQNSQNWQIHGFDINDQYIAALAYSANEPKFKKPLCFTMPITLKALMSFAATT